jgi:hypothetical protein
MKKNKKAMELSINFIVMLIIALVVFGMGLILFRQFFTSAEEIRQNLDDQTRKELEAKMMSSSEEVVVYPTQFTVKKGRGDVIGVGILNIQNIPQTFTISAVFQQGYNREGDSLDISCTTDPTQCPIQVKSSIARTVQPNKREVFDVPFKVSNSIASAKYSVLIEVGSAKNLVYIDVP